MTLKLTKESLRTAYDFMASTAPFNKWNLPDSEDVVFTITEQSSVMGTYSKYAGKHYIEISSERVTSTIALLGTMAHEMIHLHQGATKMDKGSKTGHGRAFRALSRIAMGVHGFDV